MLAGRLHPLPLRRPAPTSRSCAGSMTTPARRSRSPPTAASPAPSSSTYSPTPWKHHGVPASTLTDNGMVFTTRLSGGRGGRNGFETLLDSLGIVQKNSRPNHPTTCGKIERFHQTLKRWLDAHPTPATIDELQALCDRFVDAYNHRRPHRSLGDRTPAAAYQARPKAAPTGSHQTPSPRPSRPGQPRQRHPARRRPAASHRARPPPPRNPHHHAHQRPRRPRHPRHHRRDHPPPHHRPHPPLPRHRRTNRRTTTTLRTTKNETPEP